MQIQLYIAFDFFSISTLGGVKICALLFFRRIFCALSGRNAFHAFTLTTIIVVALWTVAFLVLSALQCGTHFSAFWSSIAIRVHYCRISYPYLLGLTISDFLLDVWIICLPSHPVSILVNQRSLGELKSLGLENESVAWASLCRYGCFLTGFSVRKSSSFRFWIYN